MYELKSENLTHLGSPMGSEYTTTNWRKFFTTIDLAKKYAEKDYLSGNKNPETIEWTEESPDHIRSQDLSFVMYHIKTVKCEE